MLDMHRWLGAEDLVERYIVGKSMEGYLALMTLFTRKHRDNKALT